MALKEFNRIIMQIVRDAVPYITTQSLYSLSGRTSYLKISWSLEAARFGFILLNSLKFDRHIDRGAAEIPIKFQSVTIIITSNLAASIVWR